MDVKTIFRNRYLEEDIYIELSLSFTSSNEGHKVYKLQRCIYGLKQVSQSWNIYFDKMIRMYGFVKNGEEPYIYKWANGSVNIFLFYM